MDGRIIPSKSVFLSTFIGKSKVKLSKLQSMDPKHFNGHVIKLTNLRRILTEHADIFSVKWAIVKREIQQIAINMEIWYNNKLFIAEVNQEVPHNKNF